MDTKKIIASWKEGANKDWLACKHLYESKDYAPSLFWGHLVIEKLLKGLVVKHLETQAPYSHDLVFLAKKANLTLIQEQRDQLNEINTFNQFGRYDNEIVNFANKCTPEYTKKYFGIINNLFQWLVKKF